MGALSPVEVFADGAPASEEREYSILLVMSELSTVRCDRALGLWIAGTQASSVDGELPWR